MRGLFGLFMWIVGHVVSNSKLLPDRSSKLTSFKS